MLLKPWVSTIIDGWNLVLFVLFVLCESLDCREGIRRNTVQLFWWFFKEYYKKYVLKNAIEMLSIKLRWMDGIWPSPEDQLTLVLYWTWSSIQISMTMIQAVYCLGSSVATSCSLWPGVTTACKLSSEQQKSERWTLLKIPSWYVKKCLIRRGSSVL